MINMMYLVLIAIMALNVSKDLLKAFVTFEEGMGLTLANSMSKNSSLYSAIEKAKSIDPAKAGQQWQKAVDIRSVTNETVEWIDALKNRLIAETEKIPLEVADTLALRWVEAKDDADIPTNIMIGSKDDASSGEARELRTKLISHYEELNDILGEDLSEGFDLHIDTNGTIEDGADLNWELSNFYRAPLAADVALLSKFKNDVRNLEYEALERLHSSINERDLPFDTVAARVISSSDYVILGDTHLAEVFVAAYSTTKDPEVELSLHTPDGSLNDMPIEVSDGSGRVLLNTTVPGLHSYSGVVRLTDNNGLTTEFPYRHEYLVARPSAAVSATKMNVFYRGIENPVEVSVPGYAHENVRVSISGGNTIRATGNGSYVVSMSANSPASVSVSVSVVEANGSNRQFAAKQFRVKKLPTPYVRIDRIKGSGEMTKGQICAVSGLIAEYAEDFPFDLSCRVVSYEVTHVQRNGTVIVHKNQGQNFEEDVKALLCASRRGDKIYFEHIRARGPDGVRPLSPLSIKIK